MLTSRCLHLRHHPFGAPFILEVPDNHAEGAFWNVPLDDLEATVHHALDNGYTVAWDADVSNEGFSFLDWLGHHAGCSGAQR